MKRFLIAATLTVITINTQVLAANVGASISIGQPGFYGQLNIGDYPQPTVIYSQPVMVEQVSMNRPPIYLHVRPGYEKHWRRHCREYNACGERVLFVQDNWYNREYVPHYQRQHRDRQGNGRNEHGNDQHGKHDDNHDQGRDH